MAYQNPFADMMKQFSEYKAPSFAAMPSVDVNRVLSSGRKTAEAYSAAGQAVAESCQAIVRRQAELARAQVEKTLKTCKDMLVNGSPEINTTKQMELAKSMFESSLNNLREVSELATKSCFEAFDVLNRRASESIEEMTSEIGGSASTSSKRKAA
jgi:phasin family protein